MPKARSTWLLTTLAVLLPQGLGGCNSAPLEEGGHAGESASGGTSTSSGGASSASGGLGAGGEGGIALSACDHLYLNFEASGTPAFAGEILPILQEGCTAGVCHGGDPLEAGGGLWLGTPSDEPMTDEEVRFVYDTLINVQAVATRKLALVRPERPRDSWLMLKLDDCLDYSALECGLKDDPGGPCGSRMPNIGDMLPEESRDLVRSWILTGAKF